jgi:hypothetical protein
VHQLSTLPRAAKSWTVHFGNAIYHCLYFEKQGTLVVKAVDYKQEGRGFEIRWGEILNVPNPYGRTRPWGLLSL